MNQNLQKRYQHIFIKHTAKSLQGILKTIFLEITQKSIRNVGSKENPKVTPSI